MRRQFGNLQAAELPYDMRFRAPDGGSTTFADLVHPEYADDPLYRWRLQVIASDVTSVLWP